MWGPANGVEVPRHPTHALKIIDNNMGDEDEYIILSFKVGDKFYSYENGEEVNTYVGDKILSTWSLN